MARYGVHPMVGPTPGTDNGALRAGVSTKLTTQLPWGFAELQVINKNKNTYKKMAKTFELYTVEHTGCTYVHTYMSMYVCTCQSQTNSKKGFKIGFP